MRNLQSLFLVVTGIMLMLATPASAQLRADMNGAQVVAPTASLATGVACFIPNAATNKIDYVISFSGLGGAETAAHLHGPAGPGANAAIIITLPLGSPKVGSFGPINIFQFVQLTGGQWYIDIHSDLYPNGEIRGQILQNTCTVPVEPTSWGAVKALYTN